MTTLTDSGSETGGDTIGLQCDPSTDTACEAAGGKCCSDDPTALLLADLDAQVTPLYEGGGGTGLPVFSGGNNALSRWGSCQLSTPNGLSESPVEGCPIPCNPRWTATEVVQVCGPNRVCCQTVELEPEDCVLDPDLGDAGCHRPVTGYDIMGLGGLDATNWGAMAHATHQDPNGPGCEAFASSIPQEVLDQSGVTQQDVLVACFRRLGVANTRGLCMDGAMVCPYADPSYIDPCEQRNADEGRTGCG